MSRRDSDSRHHHHRSSRLDPDPSPKQVKRDGRTTEQPTRNLHSTDRDKKHHHRLQDSVPSGRTVVTASKIENVSLSKESDRKSNGYREGTKLSSDNTEAPRSRSRSHYQHDERAGLVGHSFRHKETTEHESWRDKKLKDDKTRSDSLYKAEPDSKQPSKKRPFRETKPPVNEPATQGTKTPGNAEGSERKEERGKPLEKQPDRRLSGGRDPHRNETGRIKFQSSVRYGGNGNGGGVGSGFGGSFRGRDRFNERQQQTGGRVEKWKHDLYDEANKSPTAKNEEDQIAKVEALLAS